MEVRVFSRGRILSNLAAYLPVTLAAGFIYFVFVSAGLFYLLDGPLDVEQARGAAAAGSGLTVLVGLPLYVWFVVNRLSRSHLSIAGDTVTVRGQTAGGFTERRYPVGEIEAVAFGAGLNPAERVLDRLHQLGIPRTGSVQVVKDLKAGRLVVVDKAGGELVVHFFDRVFDLDSLLEFAAELSRRGVLIGSPEAAESGPEPS